MMRLITLALLLAGPARAATLNSGAAFLKINPSARSAAMGGAYATMSSADALFFNAAGLATLPKAEISAMHAQWLLDTRFDALALAAPTRLGTLGLGVARLSAGTFEGRTADRAASGGFTAQDAVYSVSFGRSILPGTGIGGSLKFLHSEIGPYSARTVAVDLGVRRELSSKPITLGLSIQNLGRGLKFLDQEDPLPTMVSAGASYRLAGVLGLAAEVRHEVRDRRLTASIGTEYSLLGALALRAGYASNAVKSVPGNSPLSGLGGGLGMRWKAVSADYSFTPFGALGDVQRVGLSARF